MTIEADDRIIPAVPDENLIQTLDKVAREYCRSADNPWKQGWLREVHCALWEKCRQRNLIHDDDATEERSI